MIINPLYINIKDMFMKIIYFKKQKNVVRGVPYFYLFYITLISCLVEDIRILLSDSLFSLL